MGAGYVHQRGTSSESLWGEPSELGKAAIIASSVVIGVTTAFLALRLWLQYKRNRLLTVENGLLVTALLLEYGAHSTNIAANYISQSWTRPQAATMLAVRVSGFSLRSLDYVRKIKLTLSEC